jgi:transposase
LIHDSRREKEAAGMALSDDLRGRVVEAVVVDRLSRNAAAKLFKVSIASAVRWVKQCETTGNISPKPCGGDRRSGRIEAHHDYLMGLIRRRTLVCPVMEVFDVHCDQRIIRNTILILRSYVPRTMPRNSSRVRASSRIIPTRVDQNR